MKMLLFVMCLTLLSLSGCATTPSAGNSRSSDLEVLRLGIHAMTEPRQVQGAVKKPSEVKDFGESLNFNVEAYSVMWLQWQDQKRLRTFADSAILAIAKARMDACGWLNLRCQARQRASLRSLQPVPAP